MFLKKQNSHPVVKTALRLQRARVQSLVRELRSHMPCSVTKTKTKSNNKTQNQHSQSCPGLSGTPRHLQLTARSDILAAHLALYLLGFELQCLLSHSGLLFEEKFVTLLH